MDIPVWGFFATILLAGSVGAAMSAWATVLVMRGRYGRVEYQGLPYDVVRVLSDETVTAFRNAVPAPASTPAPVVDRPTEVMPAIRAVAAIEEVPEAAANILARLAAERVAAAASRVSTPSPLTDSLIHGWMHRDLELVP
jgi:hypothetical protein